MAAGMSTSSEAALRDIAARVDERLEDAVVSTRALLLAPEVQLV